MFEQAENTDLCPFIQQTHPSKPLTVQGKNTLFHHPLDVVDVDKDQTAQWGNFSNLPNSDRSLGEIAVNLPSDHREPIELLCDWPHLGGHSLDYTV